LKPLLTAEVPNAKRLAERFDLKEEDVALLLHFASPMIPVPNRAPPSTFYQSV